MKIITILLLISFNAFAEQTLSFEQKLIEMENKRLQKRGKIPSQDKDDYEPTGLEKDRKGKGGYTDEWSYFYGLVGSPIVKYNNQKFTGTSLSLGHRRFAENFLYGIEYTFMKESDVLEVNDLSIHIGYQAIWRHRFRPFVAFHLGKADATDLISNIETSGYKNSIDIGLNIVRRLPIHFFTGMRYNFYNFEDTQFDSLQSQEFYFTLGLEF